jgi:hypothetical protein
MPPLLEKLDDCNEKRAQAFRTSLCYTVVGLPGLIPRPMLPTALSDRRNPARARPAQPARQVHHDKCEPRYPASCWPQPDNHSAQSAVGSPRLSASEWLRRCRASKPNSTGISISRNITFLLSVDQTSVRVRLLHPATATSLPFARRAEIKRLKAIVADSLTVRFVIA